MALVFVYGTLKRGFPNHEAGLARARFVARARTVEPYPLVVAGRWFSPCVIDEPGRGHRVAGELYEVDDRGLTLLDALEGTDQAGGYRRVEIEVERRGAGVATAWTYVKARDDIDVIHSPAMPEYRHDARYVAAARRGVPK